MTGAVDALVIGGGQAGLAACYRLAKSGASYLAVDASARIGDSWRNRYHSLTLFTPRRLSSLPGTPLHGDPEGYAGRIEFADYLERYAQTNQLAVMSGVRVVRLGTVIGGSFAAELDNGAVLHSRSVLICTGGFQQAVVPSVASTFSPDVDQLTVDTYRSPLSVGKGRVLVVGDGASGRDIAMELSATHDVVMATGKPRSLFPQNIFGINTWTLMDRLGLLSVSPRSIMGKMMQRHDPFPDRGRSLAALRRQGVSIRRRLVDASGHTANFSDGSRADVRSVIWSIGYKNDDHWVEVPTATPGLHFLGRPWQRNRASALILGAARESEIEAAAILRYLAQP